MLLPLLLPSALALTLPPDKPVVVDISGMSCSGCELKLTDALVELEAVDGAIVRFAASGACLQLSAPAEAEELRSTITELGYTVSRLEAVDACPRELRADYRPDPWDDPEGTDARIISHGEAVDLEAHLVPEHYTIVDFGAPWCGPCHTSAKALKVYLRKQFAASISPNRFVEIVDRIPFNQHVSDIENHRFHIGHFILPA